MKSISQCRQDENATINYFKICLAGLNIEVECSAGKYYNCCVPYLSKFSKTDIVAHAEREDILKRYSFILTGDPNTIKYEDDLELGAIEAEIIYENIAAQAIDFGTFLMHGAVVAKGGRAFMFSGPSGIGKSTRVRLWLDEYPDSIIVNGDKPLIKVTDDEAIACGTPWCGKEGWNTNTMVPLNAIFIVQRAEEGKASTIKEIGIGKAMPFLIQQTYISPKTDAMFKIIQLLKKLDGKVKFYQLRSNPTSEAIRLAYDTVCLE